jgi:hypothetical protein
VHDPRGMRLGKTLGHLHRQVDRLARGQRARAKQLVQRLPSGAPSRSTRRMFADVGR